MVNYLMNTRTLKLAVFVVATAMLTTVISLPAGAKDKLLTKSELKNLVANGETKSDHERVAQYFDAEAARYEAEAKEHGELASFYQKSPDPALSKHAGSQRSFQHCDSLTKSLVQAAEDARQLAVEHRAMAKDSKR